MAERLGIYVHVPFCLSRCVYCAFCSSTDMKRVDAYLSRVGEDMRRSSVYASAPSTVYVGGGTPSALGPEGLGRLLDIISDSFDLSGLTEYTVECNPDDVTPALASVLSRHGVTRVSMGVQSLNDDMLRLLNRRHDSSEVLAAISALRSVGIDNISVDIIFGLPKVEGYDLGEDLEKFVALDVQHLSAYALTVEESTPLDRLVSKGAVRLRDDDEVAEDYERVTRTLRSAGFLHYEISNYALPGRMAVHNTSYWQRVPYYGFGPAAASFVGRRRWTNTTDVAAYCAGGGSLVEEELTEAEIDEEIVMLSLRTSMGLDVAQLSEAARREIAPKVEREMADGFLERTETGNVRIPERHWLISNAILCRLI